MVKEEGHEADAEEAGFKTSAETTREEAEEGDLLMRHADQEATVKNHKTVAEQEKIDMTLHINDVAAEAWNATKDKADPAFNDIQVIDFKMKLITHAQAVKDKGLPAGTEDVAAPTDFEKKVAELLKDPTKTEAAIKKSQSAALQAQSEALAAKAKELAAEAKAK